MANMSVKGSRFRDVDRESKILRDSVLMFDQNLDHFAVEMHQDMIKLKHNSQKIKVDVHPSGRGFPRTVTGDINNGFHDSYYWDSSKGSPFEEQMKRGCAYKGSHTFSHGKELPLFDGSSSTMDLFDWGDSIEEYFAEFNPPDALKCKIAASKLEGSAHSWWKEVRNNRVLRGKHFISSWDRMRKLLISKFEHTTCSIKRPAQPVSYQQSQKELLHVKIKPISPKSGGTDLSDDVIKPNVHDNTKMILKEKFDPDCSNMIHSGINAKQEGDDCEGTNKVVVCSKEGIVCHESNDIQITEVAVSDNPFSTLDVKQESGTDMAGHTIDGIIMPAKCSIKLADSTEVVEGRYLNPRQSAPTCSAKFDFTTDLECPDKGLCGSHNELGHKDSDIEESTLVEALMKGVKHDDPMPKERTQPLHMDQLVAMHTSTARDSYEGVDAKIKLSLTTVRTPILANNDARDLRRVEMQRSLVVTNVLTKPITLQDQINLSKFHRVIMFLPSTRFNSLSLRVPKLSTMDDKGKPSRTQGRDMWIIEALFLGLYSKFEFMKSRVVIMNFDPGGCLPIGDPMMDKGSIKTICNSRPLSKDEGSSIAELHDVYTTLLTRNDAVVVNAKNDTEFATVYGPHIAQIMMFTLTKWICLSSFSFSLKMVSSASQVMVFDRGRERLVEELSDRDIVLCMKIIYHSNVGMSERHIRGSSDSLVAPDFVAEYIALGRGSTSLKYEVDGYNCFLNVLIPSQGLLKRFQNELLWASLLRYVCEGRNATPKDVDDSTTHDKERKILSFEFLIRTSFLLHMIIFKRAFYSSPICLQHQLGDYLCFMFRLMTEEHKDRFLMMVDAGISTHTDGVCSWLEALVKPSFRKPFEVPKQIVKSTPVGMDSFLSLLPVISCVSKLGYDTGCRVADVGNLDAQEHVVILGIGQMDEVLDDFSSYVLSFVFVKNSLQDSVDLPIQYILGSCLSSGLGTRVCFYKKQLKQIWSRLVCDTASDPLCNLTRGQVIPWEGKNDKNNFNFKEEFNMVKPSVVTISLCLSIMFKNGPRETLKLFHKMVNGLDPPKDLDGKLVKLQCGLQKVRSWPSFSSRGMEMM